MTLIDFLVKNFTLVCFPSRVYRGFAVFIYIVLFLLSISIPGLASEITVKLTENEQSWIDSHKTIRIGIDEGYAPYSFKIETGVYKGVALDYIEHISQILNIKFEIVPDLSWAEIMEGAKDHSIDVIATAVKTSDRDKFLDFSSIYIRTPLVIMTRTENNTIKSPSDLVGKKIALVKQYSSSQRVLRENPGFQTHFVNSPLDGLVAVSEGIADAYIGVIGVNTYLTSKHGIANLKISAAYDMLGNGQRFAVRKELGEFVPILNKVLDAIHKQEGVSILTKWIPVQQEIITTTFKTGKPKLKFTKEETAWLQKHKTIRVSNEMDWPPYDYVEYGNPTGFSIDYMNLIAQKLGINIEYINGYTWTELLEMIKRKELDVIHPLALSEERQKFLNYTESYFQMSTVFVVKKERERKIVSINDLSGMTLAIGEGYIFQNIIEQKYPEVNILPVKNALDGLKAVSFNEADAYIDTLGTVDYLIKKHFMSNLEITSELNHGVLGFLDYHIATRKDWPQLRNLIQKAILSITVEEKQNLIKKWNLLASNIGLVDLSPQEKQWLSQHKNIYLAIDPDFAPIEYINANGEYVGITADYVKLLNELLGISIKTIPDISWSEAISLAKQGKVDLFSAITPTSKRRNYLNFTQPYIKYPFVILTREDFPNIYGLQDLIDKRVVVVKNYVMQELVEEYYPDIDLILAESIHHGLVKVSTGFADAFIGDTATATYVLRQHHLSNLKFAAPTEFKSEGHSFGVRKDWPELVNIIDKTLNTITPQEHLQISKKWIEIEIDEFPTYWLWVAGISVFLLLIFVIHNVILRKQVNNRVREIATKNTLLESEITQKNLFQEKLIASEERLKQFFHATIEMVVFHEHGIIIDANPAVLAMSGYTEKEVIGKNLLEFVAEDSQEIVQKNMVSTTEDPYEINLIPKGEENNIRTAEVHAKTVNINNRQLRVVSIRDITERKKIEKTLEQHREQLEELVNERTVQLHAANDELKKFCYTLSHDLKSPLRNINGFSNILIEEYHDKLDEDANDYLSRINKSCHRMKGLIDDILIFYQLSNKKIHIKPVNISLVAVDFIESLQKNEPTRNVKIDIQENIIVNGDENLLRVVIENLLGNAWKYTGKIDNPCIEFKRTNDHTYYVRDNGAGFDMKYVDKLFHSFSRLHRYEEFPGNGIGLASVLRIIERHNGKIWAQGEVNKGATFYFTIGI